MRLDSYDPINAEIISRKFTQLAEVNKSTALKYLDEINIKYPPNSKIAKVKSNLTGSNKGILNSRSNITGQMILEVPVQNKAISQAILDKADELLILIKDINGKTYN